MSYLRAIHSFQPVGHDVGSSKCIPLQPGQIIFVHSSHASGWADGTLLETGNRGWLPSNYCEPYVLSVIRPLFSALNLFQAVIRTRKLSEYQAVVACIVSSVRGLMVI